MSCTCRVYREVLSYSTRERFQVLDITGDVEAVVARSGVVEGLAHVFARHATAAVVLNEGEPRLMSDILEAARRLAPPGAGWRHDEIDDNAHAHIGAILYGQGVTVPVASGRLLRGTWQNVLLVELDGPRPRREVVVTVIGETR